MDQRIPRVGVGVFVFRNNKFLMGCRKNSHGDGSWTVPGGHLEFGETIEQAAKREVLEETDVKIKNVRVAGITNDIFKREDKHYITIWVVSNWLRGEGRIMEPDKFIELTWRDFKTLPKPLFLPWKQLLKSKFLNTINAVSTEVR